MSRRPPSPTNGSRTRPPNFSSANSYSTLRFDENNNNNNGLATPPLRPERSVRRPLLGNPSPANMDGSDGIFGNEQNNSGSGNNNNNDGNNNNNNNGNYLNVGGGSSGASGSSSIPTPSAPVLGAMRMDGTRRPDKSSDDSASKSKRMMDRLNLSRQPSNSMLKPSSANSPSSFTSTSNNGSNSPSLSNVIPGLSRGKSHSRRSSASSTSSTQSSRRTHSPQPGQQSSSSSKKETAAAPSAAVTSALAAFSNAGARRRELGSVSDAAAVAKKSKPKKQAIPKPVYPDTLAFREVDSVLKKITREFPMLMIGTSGAVLEDEDDEEEGAPEKAFDPVTLALALLDSSNSSSNGSTLSSFLRLKSELDHSISATLSSNASAYRAFESSISGYNSTVAGLSKSQEQVAELKKSLGEVRGKLDAKGREGLAGMYNRMSHLEEMGKILDEIDSLRSIPDRLETLLSEKRFLTAVVLVVRSLKIINRQEMLEIGALGDLRAWLKLQEGVLLEILIEELHNHLYLKSFYCDARWKSYTPGQTDLPIVDFGDDFETSDPRNSSLLIDPLDPPEQQKRPEKLERYLNDLSLRPSYNPLIDEPTDDPTADTSASTTETNGGIDFTADLDTSTTTSGNRNPEGDSYTYIESLLESLACLGKLGFGLDAISQRVQIEMFNLVESTVEEVGQRNDSSKARIFGSTTTFSLPPSAIILSQNLPHHQQRGSLASLSSLSLSHAAANRSNLLRLTATETAQLELSVETLRDLFWTLYSKLLAVLMGFRVAYDVAARISERREFKDASLIKSSTGSLMFSLLEAWKPVQQEVRALLHDYLTDDQSGALSSRNPIVSVNEVLRLPKPRDHGKQIFKFADSDLKASSKALRYHEEELNRALRIAVPGLMTEPTTSTQLAVNSIITDDRYGGGRAGPGGTHKALVQADAFNVSVLFGPTFSFIEKVKEIMPSGLLSENSISRDNNEGNAFGGFLNDFVLRTFLPQLEEKVSLVFKQAVSGHDAFLDDPNYKKLSPLPIVKAVSNIMLLISSLSGMLKATPFHRENYAHLIVSVIQQFFQKCQERFKDLTARESNNGGSPLTMSATWSEISEVKSCLVELREVQPKETARLDQALRRETKIELESKGNAPITSDDLILPSKKLLALGTLYTSLDWFISQLSSVQITSDSETPAANGIASEDMPDSPELGHPSADMNSAFSIPLTQEMTKPLEQLIESYKSLSLTVLFTLRLEVRIRTIHYLDKATRDGVYQLSEDIAEPDPSVVDLNSNLAECDECAAMTLAAPERKFMFEGLSSLMDQLLISNSRHIRLANRFGLSKMMRNILALQQNLKNIGDSPLEVDFDRSRKFWEVFARGPKPMLEAIRTGALNYEFEDYKSLLNLMCGIDQSAKDDPAALSESTGGRNALGASGNGNSGVGADRGRRMYNEFLIELFALDVDG